MDWKATLEEILEERRQQLGASPTADDFVALRAGELSDEERQQLLEHAAVDPAVARELFEVLRFPEPSEDEDSADEVGVGDRWQALRQRMVNEGDLPPEAPLPMPVRRTPTWMPLAAMFVLGVATSLFVGRVSGPDSSGVLGGARINLPIVELLPVSEDDSGPRSAAEVVTVAGDAEGLVLTLAVPRLAPSSERMTYTLEVIREDGSSATRAGLVPGPGGVFVLTLPRRELADGVHELLLRDAAGETVANFRLEVELHR